MDSSDKETKRFSLKEISPFNPDSLPASITASSIHRAILDGNLENVKHLVKTGKSVNFKEEYDFTPLHLAVIKDSTEILDYLLSRDDIEVDARCSGGDTPLQTASSLGAYHTVKKLIEAGANVNLCNDKDVSPLHTSVPYPDICHILIQNNAHIDAVDSNGLTPLHRAVQLESLEVMHMLLYYNADATILDLERYTPFMLAIVHHKIEAQKALFEYVVNFSPVKDPPYYSNSLLGLASVFQSPFYNEIVIRATDVDYGDVVVWEYGCPLMLCIDLISDESVFKKVWDRLVCHQNDTPIDMCKLFDINDKKYFRNVLQIIIESDNLDVAVDSFTRSEDSFSKFILRFIESDFETEQLVVLTYRLLEYGYRPTMDDVYSIFREYKTCELHRVLLYMDIDYKEMVYYDTAISLHPTFDINFDVAVLADQTDSGDCELKFREVMWLLQYFQDSHLVNALLKQSDDDEYLCEMLNGLAKVPSLVELARNHARKHICATFRITNICRFHTIIDYMAIPSLYKDILTYKRRIYSV